MSARKERPLRLPRFAVEDPNAKVLPRLRLGYAHIWLAAGLSCDSYNAACC